MVIYVYVTFILSVCYVYVMFIMMV